MKNMSENNPIMAYAPICISGSDRDIIIEGLAGASIEREEQIENFDPNTHPVMYAEAVELHKRSEDILKFFKALPVCD